MRKGGGEDTEDFTLSRFRTRSDPASEPACMRSLRARKKKRQKLAWTTKTAYGEGSLNLLGARVYIFLIRDAGEKLTLSVEWEGRKEKEGRRLGLLVGRGGGGGGGSQGRLARPALKNA